MPLAAGAAGSPGVLVSAVLADRAYRLREAHWLDAAAAGTPARWR